MTFDDRQNAFENKHKHDQELKFRIDARAAKLFGQWLGAELGLEGDAAAAYAKEMVSVSLELPDDSDILGRALQDATAKGLSYTLASLTAKLAECTTAATQQIMTEQPK